MSDAAPAASVSTAAALAEALLDDDLAPFLGTPCGILAPLCGRLEAEATLLTVPREDHAVGMAAGAALGGATPVVLMQNSGLGQCVNALASLVAPYRIPMLLIVGWRGVWPDPTAENVGMGHLTEPVLQTLGLATATLSRQDDPRATLDALKPTLHEERAPAALLVRPDAFGWRA